MSNVSCPPHPNTLKPLSSPLPDSISNAIEAAQNIFGDLVSPSKVVCNCVLIVFLKKC